MSTHLSKCLIVIVLSLRLKCLFIYLNIINLHSVLRSFERIYKINECPFRSNVLRTDDFMWTSSYCQSWKLITIWKFSDFVLQIILVAEFFHLEPLVLDILKSPVVFVFFFCFWLILKRCLQDTMKSQMQICVETSSFPPASPPNLTFFYICCHFLKRWGWAEEMVSLNRPTKCGSFEHSCKFMVEKLLLYCILGALQKACHKHFIQTPGTCRLLQKQPHFNTIIFNVRKPFFVF